jgi:hypothetical protein
LKAPSPSLEDTAPQLNPSYFLKKIVFFFFAKNPHSLERNELTVYLQWVRGFVVHW